MKLIFTICLYLWSLPCIGQITSLDTTLTKINGFNAFASSTWGEDFAKELTTFDATILDSLIHKGKPIEKPYAFWALGLKKESDLGSYFTLLVNDQTPIDFHFGGCLVPNYSSIGDAILLLVYSSKQEIIQQSISEKLLNDFAIKFYNTKRFHSSNLRVEITLRIINIGIDGDTSYYQAIRDLALRCRDYTSHIALANFQNEKDTTLLKRLFRYSIRYPRQPASIATRFPHPAFEERLIAIFNKQLRQEFPLDFRKLCFALLQYNTLDAQNALLQIFEQPNNHYHLLFLAQALEQYGVDEKEILQKKLMER